MSIKINNLISHFLYFFKRIYIRFLLLLLSYFLPDYDRQSEGNGDEPEESTLFDVLILESLHSTPMFKIRFVIGSTGNLNLDRIR